MYSTPKDVRSIMRKLPTSVTDEDIQQFIDRAEALVNGRLGVVFALPFLSIPLLIKSITTDIATFFLVEALYSSNQPNLDEYQVTRYERAMALLEDIISGEVKLVGADGLLIVPIADAGGFDSTNTEQIFSYEEPYW